MLTNEEKIKKIHARTAELKAEKNRRRIKIYSAVSMAACVALIIGLAVIMPDLNDKLVSAPSSESMRGSILSENGILGYIIIGIVAFILGISVTVFCFKLKKWRDSSASDDREDDDDRND